MLPFLLPIVSIPQGWMTPDIQEKEVSSKKQSVGVGGGHHHWRCSHREPLHRRRGLCNHINTNLSLLVTIIDLLAWGLEVQRAASQENCLVCFPWKWQEQCFFFIFSRSTYQGSDSRHCRQRRGWNQMGKMFEEEEWKQGWLLRKTTDKMYSKRLAKRGLIQVSVNNREVPIIQSPPRRKLQAAATLGIKQMALRNQSSGTGSHTMIKDPGHSPINGAGKIHTLFRIGFLCKQN